MSSTGCLPGKDIPLKMPGSYVIQLISPNDDECSPHSLPAMNCHTSYNSCLFPSPNILHKSLNDRAKAVSFESR